MADPLTEVFELLSLQDLHFKLLAADKIKAPKPRRRLKRAKSTQF